jgi:hypothetical protein
LPLPRGRGLSTGAKTPAQAILLIVEPIALPSAPVREGGHSHLSKPILHDTVDTLADSLSMCAEGVQRALSRVRTGPLGSSAPRAGAAPTAIRVLLRAVSSGPISNSGETLGANGIDEARTVHDCALTPRTREIAPSGPTQGSLSRLAEPTL